MMPFSWFRAPRGLGELDGFQSRRGSGPGVGLPAWCQSGTQCDLAGNDVSSRFSPRSASTLNSSARLRFIPYAP